MTFEIDQWDKNEALTASVTEINSQHQNRNIHFASHSDLSECAKVDEGTSKLYGNFCYNSCSRAPLHVQEDIRTTQLLLTYPSGLDYKE